MKVIFLLLISNLAISAPITVPISLCDSTLNGKGLNCSLTPRDKDVLSFSSVLDQWSTQNINGLSYVGTFSAAGGADPAGLHNPGDFYVVIASGSINSVSYAIGDWISYNGEEWQKISNSRNVLSMFGRTANISAKEGDYSLDKLGDVDLTTAPSTNNFLIFSSGAKWAPGTLTSGAPTGSAGGDLNGSYPNPTLANSGVTAGTYKSVNVDAKGRVLSGTNPTTLAGYGITDPVVTSLSVTPPLSLGGTASVPALSMAQSTGTQDGFLSSTDWTTFNNKQSPLSAGATIHGIVYPSSATETLQIPLEAVSLTDAVNKDYVDNYTNGWVVSGPDVYRLRGKVGINTTSPAFPLSVGNGSSLDGMIFSRGIGAVGSGGDMLSISGAGKRLFWYARKAAFHAGYVSGANRDNANVGDNSASFGINPLADGSRSFSFSGKASGTSSVAFVGGIASGLQSFALGDSTAAGTSTMATGASIADGNCSSVGGSTNHATGYASSSYGYDCTSGGDYSVTLGYGLNAIAQAQVAVGMFNAFTGTETYNSHVLTDPIFVVGNGTNTGTRSNAFTVLKNGNIGVGVSAPQTLLQVAGTIGPDADASRDIGTPALKFKDVFALNGVIQTSDRRFKSKILSSDLGLRFINFLRPVSFYWKDSPDKSKHYGLIAQEVRKSAPAESFVTVDKKNDIFGVRYSELISPMIKAIQELSRKLSDRDAAREIANLRQQNAETEERIQKLRVKLSSLRKNNIAIKTHICKMNPKHKVCHD